MTEGHSPEPNPTASRWELGGRLRQLRLDAVLTIEDVARELEVSTTKISRLESGQRPATARDVRDLGRLYHLPAAEVADLKRLAQLARVKPWYAEFPRLSPHSVALFDLELVASEFQLYQAMIIPGLLQTPAYTRFLLETMYPEPFMNEEDRREVADARARRQTVALSERIGVQGHFLLDEATLARAVGGPNIMAEQVAHLADVSERSNITIQVVPFSSGAHAGMAGGFTLLRFEDQPIRDAVYLEARHADWFLDRPAEVEPYLAAFSQLKHIALDEASTRRLFEERVNEWRGQ